MTNGFHKGLDALDSGPVQSDQPASAATPGTSRPHPVVDAMRARFGDAVGTYVIMSGDENVVFVSRDSAYGILEWLKQEHQFDLCKDISAIDYGGNRPLEVFYELWSIPNKQQLRVKVVLPVDDLEADSAVSIWQTANWLEREVYDLFGINFRNHPDMRRIMMPENYAEGHPLRKDFPLRGRFSRAEQTRRALTMDVEDHYTPEEMEVGGEPSESERARQDARTDAQQPAGNEGDPALGNVPLTQRAPAQGGEASTAATSE